jgi:hypothetical protein
MIDVKDDYSWGAKSKPDDFIRPVVDAVRDFRYY